MRKKFYGDDMKGSKSKGCVKVKLKASKVGKISWTFKGGKNLIMICAAFDIY